MTDSLAMAVAVATPATGAGALVRWVWVHSEVLDEIAHGFLGDAAVGRGEDAWWQRPPAPPREPECAEAGGPRGGVGRALWLVLLFLGFGLVEMEDVHRVRGLIK